MLFGALIAPTDPIAVLAMVRKMNLSTTAETRIAGESLFNDGIGVVIFLTLLNVKIEGIENVTAQSISILFATEVIGGIILGSGLGYLGGKVLRYIENEFVELEVIITLSLVLLVSVVANKFKDVRAAICHDTYSAAQGVEHDDMNVICLGGRIVGEALAKEIVSEFLGSRFISEDRFIRRKEKLDQIEKENLL